MCVCACVCVVRTSDSQHATPAGLALAAGHGARVHPRVGLLSETNPHPDQTHAPSELRPKPPTGNHIQVSGPGFRFRIQVQDSDSGFRYRVKIQDPDVVNEQVS